MKKIARLFPIALAWVLLAPASATAGTFPEFQQTAVTLNGTDDKGQFTIFIRQTTTGSNQIVFVLTAHTFSDFDFNGCGRDFDNEDCQSFLWVAVLIPDGRLFFFEHRGDSISILEGGSLDGLPFLSRVRPFIRLGFDVGPDYEGPRLVPYPQNLPLFAFPQTAVNALPIGTYTFFAGYTTHLPSTTDLGELFRKKVSNISEFQVIIDKPAPEVRCSEVQNAGGDTPDTRVVDLGQNAGTFRFEFDTFSQKDRMVVTYLDDLPLGNIDRRMLFDTGCVGRRNSVFLDYSGNSSKVEVQVFPNCAGGSRTAWNYTVHCPIQ